MRLGFAGGLGVVLAAVSACSPPRTAPTPASPGVEAERAAGANVDATTEANAQAAAGGSHAQQLGPAAPPAPSTGCVAKASKAAGAAGPGMIRAGQTQTPYLVTLPEGHDPTKPSPLVFAFHGRGRTHLTMHDSDAPGFPEAVGSQAIVAYLKSVDAGWGESSVAPFDALYDHVLSNFCVDTERVFAAGHSSGAHFAHRLACSHSEQLRGIAAVAGGLEQSACGGRTAALLIHGQRDAVVSISRGRQALERALARNECSAETEPFGVSHCVRYLGCDPGLPVVWCDHDEPTYQDTNHGWPSFASAAVAAFFASLEPLRLPAGENLLAGTASAGEVWEANLASPDLAQVERRPGALCVNVAKAGTNPWDVQLAQHDLTLKGAGQRYRIDLQLRASTPTHVRMKVGVQEPPYGEVWVQTRAVGRETLRIIDEFALVESPPDGVMAFAVQVAGPLVQTLPTRVCIERAWLSAVAGSETDEGP